MKDSAMLYFPDVSDRMPRGPALVMLSGVAACVALWYLTVGRFSWRRPTRKSVDDGKAGKAVSPKVYPAAS
jgi:hypothetical protein